MEKVNVSEESILKAAREVFAEKGFAGARMQEIADTAGINKAMLHYYFRSKQMLFDRIFQEAFTEFWPGVIAPLKEGVDVRLFLKKAIESYITLLMNKPWLANFILSELNRDPDRIEQLIRSTGTDPDVMLQFLEQQKRVGHIVVDDVRELLANIISLCIFPFVGRPLMVRMLFRNDEAAFQSFLEKRRETVFTFISGIFPNPTN